MKKRRLPTLSSLGEFGLIARMQRRIQDRSPVLVQGIGDDCAVYRSSSGRHQVITTDALVEGVHFSLKTHSPEILGRKTLAVNLSDLAAMGAEPRVAVLALGLPATLPVRFIDRFYQGLDELGRQFGVVLAGGDTVRSPKGFWVALTLVGEVKSDRYFSRSGACSGQVVLVSGTLGDSALGLQLLSGTKRKKWQVQSRERAYLTGRHLNPDPRLAVSRALVRSRIRVGGMIDISDGLLQDLGHLCHASGVGADVHCDRLPISQLTEKFSIRNNMSSQNSALAGGEDYELLFTTPREDVKKLRRLAIRAGVPVTEIGVITHDRGKIRLLQNGRVLRQKKPNSGYDHFR